MRRLPGNQWIALVPLSIVAWVLTGPTVDRDSSAGGIPEGGEAVIQPQPRMGDPLPDLTEQELARFFIGKQSFNRTLTASEGLGPIFNKASCGNCHNNPLGGTGSQTVTRFGRSDKSGFDPLEELGGSLLQAEAIDENCNEVVPPEANVTSDRVTNGALAFGLVEAIPDAALLAVRDSQPAARRGVAHMVGAFEDPPGSPLRVGRFGWKAQVATVLTFSADASLNEMGLTNRFVPFENAPNGDQDLLAQCDAVPDPEDSPDADGVEFIDRVTDFQRFLAPAPQTPRTGMAGELVFKTIACGGCHVSTLFTPDDPSLETALRNKLIKPYSDFLLHDMGLSADFIVQGEGTERLMKTPPLWGVRKRDPMWHDGRVAGGTFRDRILHAIQLHDVFGSQARPSAQAFAALPATDQDALIAFLDSLGRIEFDHSDDEQVTLDDFLQFSVCFGGGPYTPDDACAISDIDQDGQVALNDFDSFMLVYSGPRRDCNENGIVDLRDILEGVAADADNNGIPDSCEPTCAADLNGSGDVNVVDLLGVVNQWGECPASPEPCGADVQFNGTVDVTDLLAVIQAWGKCS